MVLFGQKLYPTSTQNRSQKNNEFNTLGERTTDFALFDVNKYLLWFLFASQPRLLCNRWKHWLHDADFNHHWKCGCVWVCVCDRGGMSMIEIFAAIIVIASWCFSHHTFTEFASRTNNKVREDEKQASVRVMFIEISKILWLPTTYLVFVW